MIEIRTKAVRQYSWNGAEVEVVFRIANAKEAADVIEEKARDTELFSRFVVSVSSPDVAEWVTGVSGDAVLNTPGTLDLVKTVAMDIVGEMTIPAERKN